jgi:hypothetical protein
MSLASVYLPGREPLDLKTEPQLQQTLLTRMIQDVSVLQDHRKNRLPLTHRTLPPLFWWVSLAGFAITVSLLLSFRRGRCTSGYWHFMVPIQGSSCTSHLPSTINS